MMARLACWVLRYLRVMLLLAEASYDMKMHGSDFLVLCCDCQTGPHKDRQMMLIWSHRLLGGGAKSGKSLHQSTLRGVLLSALPLCPPQALASLISCVHGHSPVSFLGLLQDCRIHGGEKKWSIWKNRMFCSSALHFIIFSKLHLCAWWTHAKYQWSDFLK